MTKTVSGSTGQEVSDAFNEWMRRYTNEPERFEREFQTAGKFLNTPEGEEPEYGSVCASYLFSIVAEGRVAAYEATKAMGKKKKDRNK